jgi:hypothetical protein
MFTTWHMYTYISFLNSVTFHIQIQNFSWKEGAFRGLQQYCCFVLNSCLLVLWDSSKRARNFSCCSGFKDTFSSNADVSIAEHPLRSFWAPAQKWHHVSSLYDICETVTNDIFKMYHRSIVHENSSLISEVTKNGTQTWQKKSVSLHGTAVFLKQIIFCHT